MPYYDPSLAESEEDHYLNVAADLVQRYAPVPDPEPADYADKASRAERLLLNFLVNTSGASLTGASLSGTGSLSFAELKAVRAIVGTTMGTYYTAGEATTLTVASTFPPAEEGA